MIQNHFTIDFELLEYSYNIKRNLCERTIHTQQHVNVNNPHANQQKESDKMIPSKELHFSQNGVVTYNRLIIE